jgi:hypothetical protein
MPILSESQVRQATPLDKPYKLYDSGGLYLKVSTSGAKAEDQVPVRVLDAEQGPRFRVFEAPQPSRWEGCHRRISVREKLVGQIRTKV